MTKQVRNVDHLLKLSKEDFERFADNGEVSPQDVIDLWSEVLAEKERADKLQVELSEYTEANWKAFEREKKLREALEIAIPEVFTGHVRKHLKDLLVYLYPLEKEGTQE